MIRRAAMLRRRVLRARGALWFGGFRHWPGLYSPDSGARPAFLLDKEESSTGGANLN
jgi:hypothetical protein